MRTVTLHNKIDDEKPSSILLGGMSEGLKFKLKFSILVHAQTFTCVLGSGPGSGQGCHGNPVLALTKFVAPVVPRTTSLRLLNSKMQHRCSIGFGFVFLYI